MLSDVIELLGVACIAVAVAFIAAWPFALFPIGIYLVIAAFSLDDGNREDEQ